MLRPNVAGDGEPARCPDCADLRFDYQCAGCGRFTRPLRRGNCPACRLTAAIRAAVPEGVSDELTEFVEEALLVNPGRGLRILGAPETAALLRGILSTGRRPQARIYGGPARLRHQQGTGQPPCGNGEHHDGELLAELRTALAVAGILPSEPSLDRYQERVDELVASVPESARLVVRRYVRWALTRPLQRQVDDGATITASLVRWPLLRARVATEFTTAACTHSGGLDGIGQSHLDAWLTELPSHRAPLRAFVRWATAHGYMHLGLDVPAASSRERRTAMDDTARLDLARHLLRERTEDPPARLAAVLVLLFGQRVTRLATLEHTALTLDDDGRVTITLADTPVRLREPLAGLAVQVADSARASGSAWMFPSSQGNRPLSADRLRGRLAYLGLTRVLEARNAAVGALAAQVPPALLAEHLGLSLSAAAAWSKAAGAARSDYAALRSGR
ncbi:hypothetical protein ACIBMZ_20525 [Micromonospora sp. NPDC049900]|uniref:hypothetical protein n=1 Tax=Micromonospora sp. NPDC049900 TaxID=3364275 RepID=UPI00378FF960